jgi:hypothetical protein
MALFFWKAKASGNWLRNVSTSVVRQLNKIAQLL